MTLLALPRPTKTVAAAPAGPIAQVDTLRLQPRALFAWHIGVIAFLALAGTAVAVAALSFDHPYLFGLSRLFDLDRESNVPSLVSALGLLAAALLLALVARDERRRGSPLRRHWAVLALGFGLLAVDESASMHELFNLPVRTALGEPGFAAAWVVVGGLAVVAVGLAFLPFLFAIRPETARLSLLAAILFLGGALGLESIGSEILEYWPRASYPFQIEVVIEETTELVGIACFIFALLRELEWRGVSLTLRFG